MSGAGIGDATVGSTLAQMQADLGPDYEFLPVDQVIVDFGGYEIRKDGTTQFFAAGDAGADELTILIVDNPAYTTAVGVGAGSLLADAETAYGLPTLSYNVENEGREFATFARGPSGRVLFRTGSFGDLAGVYDDPDAGFGETSSYVDGSTIESIWITCIVGRDCPQRYLPETGGQGVALQFVLGASLVVAGALFLMTERRLVGRLFAD